MGPNIVIESSLDDLAVYSPEDYLAHIVCLGGACSLLYNEKEYRLAEGSLMIVMKGHNIKEIRPTPDFRVKVLYAAMPFVKSSTPQSNYGMKGLISLISEPVMQLSQAQREICEYDIDAIERRLKQSGHNFYPEAIRNALQGALLDFFDFHSRIYGTGPISIPKATIMERFFGMLESGIYRSHRNLAYYADLLCVTTKYLSETSKKISGHTASYWINQYTSLEIARALRDKSLTFKDISEQFCFSSLPHFTQYVQRQLGMSPSSYRHRNSE